MFEEIRIRINMRYAREPGHRAHTVRSDTAEDVERAKTGKSRWKKTAQKTVFQKKLFLQVIVLADFPPLESGTADDFIFRSVVEKFEPENSDVSVFGLIPET